MTQNDLNRFINSLLDDLVENDFFPILYREKYIYTVKFHHMFSCNFTQLETILVKHLAQLRKFSVTKNEEIRSDNSVFIKFFIHEKGTNKYRQGFSCEFTIKSTTSVKTLLADLPFSDSEKVSEAVKDLRLQEYKEAKIRIVDAKLC